MPSTDPMAHALGGASEYGPHHPHEPEIAPALDADGRCLVCGLLVENERLREAINHAIGICDHAASMQCSCDGYYKCNRCPVEIANRAEDAAEFLKHAMDDASSRQEPS